MPTVQTVNASVKFSSIAPELFNEVAKDAAIVIAQDTRTNKPSQLRKFYDELTMWNERVQNADKPDEQYAKLAAFIKMMNAKVAYAKGRKHVDDNFAGIFTHCISEVKSAESLNHCKLFIEAFMGFYKEQRPKD